jgi:hypothetical protein
MMPSSVVSMSITFKASCMFIKVKKKLRESYPATWWPNSPKWNTSIPLSIVGNSEHRYGNVVGKKWSNEIGNLMRTDDERMGGQEDSTSLMTLNVLLATDLQDLGKLFNSLYTGGAINPIQGRWATIQHMLMAADVPSIAGSIGDHQGTKL